LVVPPSAPVPPSDTPPSPDPDDEPPSSDELPLDPELVEDDVVDPELDDEPLDPPLDEEPEEPEEPEELDGAAESPRPPASPDPPDPEPPPLPEDESDGPAVELHPAAAIPIAATKNKTTRLVFMAAAIPRIVPGGVGGHPRRERTRDTAHAGVPGGIVDGQVCRQQSNFA
jgi:hypothetical protein